MNHSQLSNKTWGLEILSPLQVIMFLGIFSFFTIYAWTVHLIWWQSTHLLYTVLRKKLIFWREFFEMVSFWTRILWNWYYINDSLFFKLLFLFDLNKCIFFVNICLRNATFWSFFWMINKSFKQSVREYTIFPIKLHMPRKC